MVDLLKGVRVLSFNHFLMGPLGVQFLADLGADVIAVEPPDGAFQRKWSGANNKRVDGQSMLLLVGNRNKRSLVLDLKKPEAIEIACKLIATADVLTENFRPGVLDKLGLGYDAARAIKPDIIYATASGFGPDGPYVNRPGQDLLVQALSGLATITGTRRNGPRAIGVSAVDHHGAVLFAAGILAALVGRAKTGKGCRVDANLLSAALDLQQESLTCYMNGAPPDDTHQPEHVAGWYYSAPYGLYATRDGHVAISLGSLDVLGDALDLPSEQRVPDSEAFTRRDEITTAIAANVAKRTTAECVEIFTARGIWHAPVNDYSKLADDPQIVHNGSFQTVPGATGVPITLVSHPIQYDGQVPEVRLPPQELGAQSKEILTELGYDNNAIQSLYRNGAIGSAS
ncbi:CaiB/BaiF CoA transferase family protein [Bradyrhizobium cenepequi]|uniref:CaiB/BaiF CoA transferase family protein n=1 Tax=Bradyrhizobium cenepequi TaxID=2821403 RepID=UPI001CE2B384|nr:CoA transferase [Bradyrhizobium cenepequi]MCA6112230.1 CoA transferase [Bradyrhizobium cenepequi]